MFCFLRDAKERFMVDFFSLSSGGIVFCKLFS